MAEIQRTPAGLRLKLDDDEMRMLTRLVDDIDELLAGTARDVRSPDPLVELTGLDVDASDVVEAPDDPALRRLLPDAYRDDDEAAADFRRYTENSLRGAKRADATVVRQGLASIAALGERILDDEQADAWLRFLTDARLVIASRLGIETADDVEAFYHLPASDPRLMLYGVYEWLLALLGGLLAEVGG
jgi:hypothetical protein